MVDDRQLLEERDRFGTPKTARGRRLIALDDFTLAALSAHRVNQHVERSAIGESYVDHDLVFPKLDGTPTHPDYFSQAFDRAVARLKLPRIPNRGGVAQTLMSLNRQ
jgi:hypothetical protein